MRSNLKIRFKMDRSRRFISYSPSALQVRFNDEDILVDSLTLELGADDMPRATMRITLTELDIDADTIVALTASAGLEVRDAVLARLAGDAKDKMVEQMLIEKHRSVGFTSMYGRSPIFPTESLEMAREVLWGVEPSPASAKLWSAPMTDPVEDVKETLRDVLKTPPPKAYCGHCGSEDWQDGCDRIECNFRDNYSIEPLESESLSLQVGLALASASAAFGIAAAFFASVLA